MMYRTPRYNPMFRYFALDKNAGVWKEVNRHVAAFLLANGVSVKIKCN